MKNNEIKYLFWNLHTSGEVIEKRITLCVPCGRVTIIFAEIASSSLLRFPIILLLLLLYLLRLVGGCFSFLVTTAIPLHSFLAYTTEQGRMKRVLSFFSFDCVLIYDVNACCTSLVYSEQMRAASELWVCEYGDSPTLVTCTSLRWIIYLSEKICHQMVYIFHVRVLCSASSSDLISNAKLYYYYYETLRRAYITYKVMTAEKRRQFVTRTYWIHLDIPIIVINL